MNKSSVIDLAKKYKIHIILFSIAIVVRLSINCSICGGDSDSYFFGAKSILQNHTYLVVGNPPAYPMGYSLLIVPFFYFFGINSQSAVYPCALLGALTVVLLYDFVKDLVDTRAAIFASVFLIFAATHWYFSTSVWSEAPSLFFILLSIVAAVKYANTEKAVFIYLFYFTAGFACLIRYTSGIVFIIVGLYIIISNKIHLLKHKEVWIGTLISLVIVSPQLIYNYIYFGSVFRTGYLGVPEQMFSLEYIFTPGENRHQLQIVSYLRCLIVGFGSLLLPFYLYGMWDLIKQRSREILSLIIPWIVVPFVTFSCYFWTSLRLIISILPALLILSGIGFSKICDRLGLEAESNEVKQNKTGLSNFKTIKMGLIILLIVILLIPTAIVSFDIVQQSEARADCIKETFVWIRENSDDDDIILSDRQLSYEFYSQRRVYPLQTSHKELERLISTHDNVYLVIHESQQSQNYRQYISDTEQRLNKTYGLIHLKTFETDLSSISKILHDIKIKCGINPSPATDRWDVYLIAK